MSLGCVYHDNYLTQPSLQQRPSAHSTALHLADEQIQIVKPLEKLSESQWYRDTRPEARTRRAVKT